MDSPLEVLERRRKVLIERDMAAFADLFAVDGVIEMPFGTEGLPARLEGREAIREYATSTADRPVQILDLRIHQIHETHDPEVVIVELTTVGRVTTTGADFVVPCIQVFRIRDGAIVLFRDYVGAASVPEF